ncbi:MAG: glycerol kinase, partial [Actinobacteria bacterium]|nr:glycerol kinase [Actinomycetota bacterium]
MILSVDAGTTGITALVIDRDRHVLGRGYQDFPQHFPEPGWVEHDPNEIWSALLVAATRALEGIDKSKIEGIGITNQRETLVLWDRETLGTPRRAIVWQDRRTTAICERLKDVDVRNTGLRMDPYFTGTKALWIAENEPRTWRYVDDGRIALGTIDSYLIARMSRGLDHVTDATNASRTLMYDLTTGDWDDRLLKLFQVPRDALPTITASWGDLAHTDPTAFLGLDVPITGIAGDQQSALISIAGFDPGSAACAYGTGSFLLVNSGNEIPSTVSGTLATVAWQAPDSTRAFASEGGVFVTGAAVQWFRDGLGAIKSSAEIEELARSVESSEGVVMVPALAGLGAPLWNPHARGAL